MKKIPAPEQREITTVQSARPLSDLRPQSSNAARTITTLTRASAVIALSGIMGIGNNGCSRFPNNFYAFSPDAFSDPEQADLPPPSFMIHELEEAFNGHNENNGEVRVKQYLQRQRLRAKNAAPNLTENPQLTTKLEGLDAFKIKIPAQELQPVFSKFLREGFPQTWSSRQNLKVVHFEPHEVKCQYPGLREITVPTFTHIPEDGMAVNIEMVSRDIPKNPEMEMMRTLEYIAHELSHANDWSSSPDLSPQHALELMYRAYKLSTAPDRPKFNYPESIKSDDISERDEVNMYRMTEYFADLAGKGLNIEVKDGDTWEDWEKKFAEKLTGEFNATEDAAKKNVHFVRRFFHITNPDFNIVSAFQKRQKAIDEFMAVVRYYTYKKSVAEITDAHFKEIAVKALNLPREAFNLPEEEAAKRRAELEKIKPEIILAQPKGMTPEQQNVFHLWGEFFGQNLIVRQDYLEKTGHAHYSGIPKDQFDRVMEELKKLPAAEHPKMRTLMLEWARKAL